MSQHCMKALQAALMRRRQIPAGFHCQASNLFPLTFPTGARESQHQIFNALPATWLLDFTAPAARGRITMLGEAC